MGDGPGNIVEQEWGEPLRQMLVLHARPAIKAKSTSSAEEARGKDKGKVAMLVCLKDPVGFLATLSTSPGIALWLTV